MSDSHGGHILGLTNPETELQDDKKGHYQPDLNDYQMYLWDRIYIHGIKETIKLADKDEVIVFHIGDVTQGNKYPNEQMTTRMGDQLRIAKSNMFP